MALYDHAPSRSSVWTWIGGFAHGATLQPKYGIYCVDRWREDALKEQELETEKWIFSFQEAAQQQRLLDSVSEQAAVAPLPEQHYIP